MPAKQGKYGFTKHIHNVTTKRYFFTYIYDSIEFFPLLERHNEQQPPQRILTLTSIFVVALLLSVLRRCYEISFSRLPGPGRGRLAISATWPDSISH